MDTATQQQQLESKEQTLKDEKDVLELLLERGVIYGVTRQSIFKIFSKSKKRNFEFKRLYLGTMDHIARLQLDMYLNEGKIKEDIYHEKNLLISKNARLAAKVISYAYLNSYWGIKLFGDTLSKYLFWRMDSKSLLEMCNIIMHLYDIGNFIDSIRLMSGIKRMSEPKPELIEEKTAQIKTPEK